MRTILVGVLVAVVAVAGPASAHMGVVADEPAVQSGGQVHFTNPSGRVVVENEHGAGAEFGLALASTVTSLAYTPFRFVFGVIGAGLGGIGGWATGGDMRTAKGLWRPTTEGHYYIRPDYFDGTERFRFSGAVSPVRERVVEESVVMTREPVAPQPELAPRPLDSAPFSDEAIDDAL